MTSAIRAPPAVTSMATSERGAHPAKAGLSKGGALERGSDSPPTAGASRGGATPQKAHWSVSEKKGPTRKKRARKRERATATKTTRGRAPRGTRSGAEQSGAERSGAGSVLAVRSGAEQSGAERSGAERSGAERFEHRELSPLALACSPDAAPRSFGRWPPPPAPNLSFSAPVCRGPSARERRGQSQRKRERGRRGRAP